MVRRFVGGMALLATVGAALAGDPPENPAESPYTFPTALICGFGSTLTIGTASYAAFNQSVSFAPGGKTLRVFRTEGPPMSETRFSRSGTETTSSRITSVAATHGGNVLFVGLVDDLGAVRIEKWVFPTRNGLWIHTPPESPSPTEYMGVTKIKGGGLFDYTRAGPIDSPQRTVVFRSRGHTNEIRALTADPEGRFLVAIDHDGGAGKIWRIDTGTWTPELLFDSETLPEVQALWNGCVYEHKTLGRVHRFTNDRPWGCVGGVSFNFLLRDADNDGAFDETIKLNNREWDADPLYSKWSNWTPIESAGIEE